MRWVSVLILLVVIVGSIALAINPGAIMWLGQWGYFGAFTISLVASASIILPIPGLPIAMAMGTVLNPLLLGFVTGFGSAIGELTGYLAGASGRALAEADQQPQFGRIHGWTERYGPLAIFVLAATPFPLFDLAGIAAGATGMPLWSFFLATALGKIVKYTIAIYLGAGSVHYYRQWME